MDDIVGSEGSWARWLLGSAVVTAIGSCAFVVQLAIRQGQLEQRQTDADRWSDEQRKVLHDEMIYRFDQVDRELQEMKQRSREAPVDIPKRRPSDTPIFGPK